VAEWGEKEVYMKKETSSQKRILFVDDDPVLIKCFDPYFRNAGYAFETASHGLEALEKVKQFQPHLIILDVMLPNLDGLKVAGILHKDRRFKDIPIIILTSRATDSVKETALRFGVNDCIFKPIRMEEMIVRVKKALNE
jgi:two-component system alkaline phosphatase synthesis response regulator PhoP